MIYVVGCPSGGTSAVAGMLRSMGVKMGVQAASTTGENRGPGWVHADWWHDVCECPFMSRVLDEYWLLNTPFLGWNHVRAKSIIDMYARTRSKDDGLCGVKDVRLGALLCDAKPSPDDAIVVVDRSFNASFRSWVNRAVKLGCSQQFDHAGFVAQCHWFKEQVAKNYPVIRVSYEDMLDDAGDTAAFLAFALKLDESKVDDAAKFVTDYKGQSFSRE